MITVAVPKGRILAKLGGLLERAGLDASPLRQEDRRLSRDSDDGGVRYLFLKPDDVPTYVEYGAADLGFCGRDVLDERGYDLYRPLDLGVGRCRMVVARPDGCREIPDVPRVATKFAKVAERHFAARGAQAEIVYVGGSVELAPLVGLADLIVDLVESGATLRENHLHEVETVLEVSTLLVANRAAYKLKAREVAPYVDALRRATE
ncbi:MAG: ATP phosphoribosyltransferase [Polyangiaceae bacterium]|nr:ATP phosphoribosyltransferase [Polyangiaceae bacterium]